MRTQKSSQGFTLIELMIAVAVVGILLAVGLPSYGNAMRKAHRADAQAALMNIAARQQQMLVDTRKYAGTVAELNTTVPDKVAARYSVGIALGTGTAPSFVISATPQGSQAQDSCGVLSVDNHGVKAPAHCW